MTRRFAKVSEEEIDEAFFYPSDLVDTKTTILLRVVEERWIYASTLSVSVYIHHYSCIIYSCEHCLKVNKRNVCMDEKKWPQIKVV